MVKFIHMMAAILLLALSESASADTLDLGKALKIGTGAITVIEITDPDCPYCRKAYQYFLTRPDVTLYIYFNPLSSHHDARQKARYILSADDRERAYAEVMSGLYDTEPPSVDAEKGKRLLDEQMSGIARLGLSEVPVFMVYGRVIKGFDQKLIEAALPPPKK